MIVNKENAAQRNQVIIDIDGSEAPPSYSYSPGPSSRDSAPNLIQCPDIEATNCVQIIRKEGSVKGTWILDPTLKIPSALLPPLPDDVEEHQRRNLHLQSKEGNVYGEAYIKPTSLGARSNLHEREKVSIYAGSKEGKVELRIHDADAHAGIRPPVIIKGYAKEGDIRIYLPQSFNGPFRITTRSSSKRALKLSPGILSQLSAFSENVKVKQGFIGQHDSAFGDNAGKSDIEDWNGDFLEAEICESSSRVKVFFDDEESKSHNCCLFKRVASLF